MSVKPNTEINNILNSRSINKNSTCPNQKFNLFAVLVNVPHMLEFVTPAITMKQRNKFCNSTENSIEKKMDIYR